MSAQPIVFDIPEDAPVPRRSLAPRQSWLQDLQPAGPIAGENAWFVELTTAPQVFSQPRSVRTYVETSGTESSPVIGEIDALLAGREDEVVPTRYAYEIARSLIEAAYGEINSRRAKKRWGVPEIFPKALVTTDDVGGIRVSWRTDTGQVRANFGARPEPELRSYVYFESGLEHDVEPLDVQHLAGRLTWLTRR
jgi:hypothetical protein